MVGPTATATSLILVKMIFKRIIQVPVLNDR